MSRFKLVGVMLGALFALAMMASSASAFTLPDISVTLGGAYPLVTEGNLTAAKTSLGSASGITLEGTGVTLLLKTAELSASGAFTSTFTKVAFGTKKCLTSGQAAGTVVIPGTYDVVPLNTTGTIGLLYLLTATTITCEGNEVAVKGDVISSINAGTESQELTSLSGKLEGSKGKQTISEFINDNGSKVKAKLEAETNKSGEFVASDENVNEELKLAVTGSKMLVITGR